VSSPLALRQPLRVSADPSRVVATLFVPGHAFAGGGGRATEVVGQLRSLDDAAVAGSLAWVHARFGARHRDLTATFRMNADRMRNRLPPGEHLSEDRWLLLGATFTQELALEGAAVCNPSMIPLHGRDDLATDEIGFVMSVRQIGEGHRSSIGFRTGVVDATGAVSVDARSQFSTTGAHRDAILRDHLFRDGSEPSGWVLDHLGTAFTRDALDTVLAELDSQRDTRRDVAATIARIRSIADRTYSISFPATSSLDERVLHPAMAAESNGLEDARFTRVTHADGRSEWCATYTAFDGSRIAQQLLTTEDFETFRSSPLLGAAAANKGLALFPRTIQGDYVALTRFDGANNAVARSAHLDVWPTATPIRHVRAVWEMVQAGNCGSPIETDAGWLVLTHGVGPMRTYAIGAWLLDLEDPTRLLGQLAEPLLTPTGDEQDGYVPNVVYSCGAMAHGDRLVIPYGIGDATIGFASASISGVIEAMTS
jgi:predicted GH43/DUF377 family glycosyl hydrolase